MPVLRAACATWRRRSHRAKLRPVSYVHILATIAIFVAWALLHSVTAARPVKRWVRQQVGERVYDGFYRLFYNVLSVLTILPLLYVLARWVPSTVLWRVPPPLNLLFILAQVVGVGALAVSLLQTDVLRFAGLRQVLRFARGEARPDPPEPFVRSGLYGLVRHPLYFFSLLIIWFTPVMTLNALLFDLLATVYFVLGAWHEERRLLRQFGDTYRRYRREVPSFIPFLHLPW